MKIKNSGKETFYARDFGFTGGDITYLYMLNLIQETGNKNQISYISRNGTVKKSYVKEWKFNQKVFEDTMYSLDRELYDNWNKDNIQEIFESENLSLLYQLRKKWKRGTN
jgi:hypothetical protein